MIELPRFDAPPAVPGSHQIKVYARSLVTRPRARLASTGQVAQFMVFAQGRTGSTLLVDLLRSCSLVRCDEEILSNPVSWPLRWIDGHRARYPRNAYGFKAKIYQLTDVQGIGDVSGWLSGLHGRGWSLIHLYRRNLLRQVLSNIAAQRRGSFVYRTTPPPLEPLHVDPTHLLEWMRIRSAVSQDERAALANVPHITLCYEDDLLAPERHQSTLDRLTRDLGLPSAAATTSVRRTITGSLGEIVANANEIEAALVGTEWERHLHW